jgi:hypothetical protein
VILLSFFDIVITVLALEDESLGIPMLTLGLTTICSIEAEAL